MAFSAAIQQQYEMFSPHLYREDYARSANAMLIRSQVLWKRNLLALLGAIMAFCAYSQEPSYEIYGRDELSGLTIYDQLMNKDDVLYIATSDGLYRYNSITFEKIKVPKISRAKSLFDLKLDKDNNVYCSNLSGQFFKVNGDSLELFYQLEDDVIGVFSKYEFVQDQVVITGLNNALVDEKGTFVKQLPKSFYHFLSDDLFATSLADTSGAIRIELLAKNDIHSKALYTSLFRYVDCSFFMYHDKFNLYLRSNCTDSTYRLNLVDQKVDAIGHPQSIQRGIKVDDSTFWSKLEPNGTLETKANLLDTSSYRYFYSDKYTAPQDANAHGIFLGSNGTGIYQVKNRFFQNVTLDGNYEIAELLQGPADKIIARTVDNKVLSIDPDLHVKRLFVCEEDIGEMLYRPDRSQILVAVKDKIFAYSFVTDKLVEISSETPPPAMKEWVVMENGELLYAAASSYGKMVFKNDSLTMEKIAIVRSSGCKFLNGKPFFATIRGLVEGIDPEKYVLWKGEKVYASKLLKHRNSLIIYSVKNGVLTYTDGVVRQLKMGQVSARDVRDVFMYDNQLLVATKNGIYIFDTDMKHPYLISTSDGLHSNNVISSCIRHGFLYLLTDMELQRIQLSKLTRKVHVPEIHFGKITINGLVGNAQQTDFAYWQNRMTFEVIGNAFGKQKDTKYKYKLEGLSTWWREREYYNNVIEFQSLPPGDYVLRIVPVYKGKEGKEIQYTFSISPPFWQQWWFYVAVSLLCALLALLTYRRYTKKLLRKTLMDGQINKLRLIAIQSQMNPHFIFNSINAIQESVMNEDADSTYEHVQKFSNLVRLTLNHSERTLISLSEELELLQLYLELERIRFSDNFEFSMRLEADVSLKLPPLLVQPFVENAILHGLFHQDGKKELKISIREHENEVIITIQDNGIGREASAEINKKRKRKYEKPFATRAMKERMSILNEKYHTDSFGFEYVDMENGTLVQINLPRLSKQ